MDFWDLTKLLFRRWYFALPLLLFSMAAVMWTMSAVKPNYLANAYIQLIPPTVVTPEKPNQTNPTRINPWGNLGLYALANAATVTVQDEKTLTALVEGGYSDNFTLTVNNANALLSVEVTGTTQDQARASADELVKLLEQAIADLQATFTVPQTDLITTKRLDNGNNLKESNSNVKRAVVAVGAAGVLITLAVTIGLDALLRRRRRRLADEVDPDLSPDGALLPPPPARTEQRASKTKQPQPKARPATTAGQSNLPAVSPAIRTHADRGVGARPSSASPASQPPVTLKVDYYGNSADDADPTNPIDANGGTPIPADATIVLPLSHQKARGWGGQGGEGKSRR